MPRNLERWVSILPPASPLTQPSSSAALRKVRNKRIPGALPGSTIAGLGGGRKSSSLPCLGNTPPEQQRWGGGARSPSASGQLVVIAAARQGRGGGKGGCDGRCCSNLIESICQFTTRITSGSILSFCCRVRIFLIFYFFFPSLLFPPSPSGCWELETSSLDCSRICPNLPSTLHRITENRASEPQATLHWWGQGTCQAQPFAIDVAVSLGPWAIACCFFFPLLFSCVCVSVCVWRILLVTAVIIFP